MYAFIFAGTSSSGKIAVTGHSGSQAPIDALVGMDVELVGSFIDAVDRADIDARAVFGILAGFSYDVGHVIPERSMTPAVAASSRAIPLRKIDPRN